MAEVAEAASGSTEKEPRGRTTIAFPYNDLNDAIGVASAIHRNVGMGTCGLDQLAPWLGHGTITSGAFRLKVAAAKTFGLINTERQRLSLTSLGRRIVDSQQEPKARVDAFLSVQLYKALFEKYRGGLLPPEIGLENEIRAMGVPPKQADKARQVFRRSADQAGFFKQGSNRLVLPAVANSQPGTPGGNQSNRSGSGSQVRRTGGGGGGGWGDLDPKIQLLIAGLPPSGDTWSAIHREAWLSLMEDALTGAYPEPLDLADDTDDEAPE